MTILFQDSKFRKTCNNLQSLTKAFGPEQADRIRRRLDAIHNANTLEDLRHAPGRLHELTGNGKYQLSLDLKHPYRLLLRPLMIRFPTTHRAVWIGAM